MASYTYYVPDPTNISSKITQLTNKINIDLDIGVTLNGITYNSTSQTITINFSSALTGNENIILLKLVEVNIFGNTPGIELQAVLYDHMYRNSVTATANPTVNHDLGNFYVPGSIVINDITNEGFLCVKNDLGNAIWVKIDSPTITANSDNSINLSLDGNSYRLLEGPTGSTGNYVLNIGSTGAYTFNLLNYARNILGSTGATDPNGTANPSDYNNPIAGDQYYDRITGQNWIYNGTSWDYVISGITGATGSQGPTGPQGSTGIQGPTGTISGYMETLRIGNINSLINYNQGGGNNQCVGALAISPPLNTTISSIDTYVVQTGSTGIYQCAILTPTSNTSANVVAVTNPYSTITGGLFTTPLTNNYTLTANTLYYITIFNTVNSSQIGGITAGYGSLIQSPPINFRFQNMTGFSIGQAINISDVSLQLSPWARAI